MTKDDAIVVGIGAERSGIVAAEKKSTTHRARPQQPLAALIPMAMSVRHVHLTQETVERLFGPGYLLSVGSPLSQPGQYAAEETVTLVGPPWSLAIVA